MFTLLPLFPVTADYIGIFKESTKDFLPQQAHQYLFKMVEGVSAIKRGGLQSLGFVFAIIFSSTGMLTLMYGFYKTHERVFKKRSYVKNRLVAILLTIMLGSIFMTSIFLIIFGEPVLSLVIEKLNLTVYSATVFTGAKWLVVFLGCLFWDNSYLSLWISHVSKNWLV